MSALTTCPVRKVGLALGSLALMAFPLSAVRADDWEVRDIAKALFSADKNSPVDFSGADLSFLDLSGLDFKHARFDDARLHGSDLTGANFADCSLQRAILDRATLIDADFSDADLTGVLIRLPHSAGSPGFDAHRTPDFARANLRSARVVGRFDGGNFREANFDDANLGPYGDWTQNTQTRRLTIVSGDFAGASLVRANLSESTLSFTSFRSANLMGANLQNADVTGTDFSGADLRGAKVAGANFERADLRNAKGLDKLIGKEAALNWPAAVER